MMRISVMRFSCVLALASLGACAFIPDRAPEQPEVKTSDSAPVAPTPEPAAPAPTAAQANAFKTRHASFIPMAFNDVPGWKEDDMQQSWSAFMQSCNALRSKNPVWTNVCAKAQNVKTSPQAIRLFFEREFIPFQIQDLRNRRQGMVTGYFEPQLNGSRQYKPPYIYPVYAPPSDMLYLDARRVPASAKNQTVSASVQGNRVTLGQGDYTLDLKQVTLNVLDKKVRLRAEGNRLLPYYTRAEIESLGVPNARVIAFVDDLPALYEMQIQGSGRIQLTDGSVIRLSMSEQNGHPFRPVLAKNKAGKSATKTVTRGGEVELDVDDYDDDEDTDGAIRTRGFKLVSAVIGKTDASGRAPAGSAGNSDPSYVFFSENPQPDSKVGPVGALGVPLTAGRSIAVDPRNVPMGYPVFVSTRTPGTKAPLRRLTVAQDMGGAIRGAVRADYFFGFGQTAKANASRMKEIGEMWVLLPQGVQLAAAASGVGSVRVRGGGGGEEIAPAECLIPEDDICVEAPE